MDSIFFFSLPEQVSISGGDSNPEPIHNHRHFLWHGHIGWLYTKRKIHGYWWRMIIHLLDIKKLRPRTN